MWQGLTGGLRQNGIYVAFVAIVALAAITTRGLLLSPDNLTNLVLQYSYIFILAIGMLIVIIAGHIDLSVGSIVALAGAVSATLVIKEGMPWWVGALAGVAVGFAAGAWHGFWVAVVRIPAWVTTLAGMLLFRGLTLLVLKNTSLSPFGAPYTGIAAGFQHGLLGGGDYDVFTLLVFALAVVGFAASQWRIRRGRLGYQQAVEAFPAFVLKILAVSAVVMWFAYQLSRSRGLPNILIILAVVVLAYSAIMRGSVFGRGVYAIGGNLHAAQLSGVKVQKLNFWIMTNMGILSGLAGVVFSSRTNGAQPGAGNAFEMDAIAACFIGGAAASGGAGTVSGVMVGGLIMAVLSNSMQLLGMDQSMQQVVKGAILLAAVAFDIYNRRRASTAG
ncbi:multiple monosaccharide ABC transporter permease [Cellulomonas sp. KRMCY2]|uniref:multiple monosaccharide ABC transporter permease n=1 Tax=Cellulomonas sp. KRMCY2 TaxID=1304865 RepID=UPI00045E8141|nr:multiple monosaccharide ABC transporter permease [Cellulomonas sp. KRMCY2]